MNIPLAACIPGAVNTVSDFMTVILPIPLVWNIHLKRKSKIQVLGISSGSNSERRFKRLVSVVPWNCSQGSRGGNGSASSQGESWASDIGGVEKGEKVTIVETC